MSVISITEKVNRRKALVLKSLVDIIIADLDNAIAHGTPMWTCAGALTTALASILAEMDPNLEHAEWREALHEYLNRAIDEAVLSKWEDGHVG